MTKTWAGIFCVAVVLLASSAEGQWAYCNGSNGPVCISSNVGIGTPGPVSLLELGGSTSGALEALTIVNSSAGQDAEASIVLDPNGDPTSSLRGARISGWHDNVCCTQTGLKFYTGYFGANREVMRTDSNVANIFLMRATWQPIFKSIRKMAPRSMSRAQAMWGLGTRSAVEAGCCRLHLIEMQNENHALRNEMNSLRIRVEGTK